MTDFLVGLAIGLAYALCAVLYAAAEAHGELARCAQYRLDIMAKVFTPWLDSIKTSDADAELRLRDYSDAWDRWSTIKHQPTPTLARWSDRAFGWLEARSKRKAAAPDQRTATPNAVEEGDQ